MQGESIPMAVTMDPTGFDEVTETIKQLENWQAFVNSTFNGRQNKKQLTKTHYYNKINVWVFFNKLFM